MNKVENALTELYNNKLTKSSVYEFIKSLVAVSDSISYNGTMFINITDDKIIIYFVIKDGLLKTFINDSIFMTDEGKDSIESRDPYCFTDIIIDDWINESFIKIKYDHDLFIDSIKEIPEETLKKIIVYTDKLFYGLIEFI